MPRKDVQTTPNSEEQRLTILIQQFYTDIQKAKKANPIIENAMTLATSYLPKVNITPQYVKTAYEVAQTFGLTPEECNIFSNVSRAVISVKRTDTAF